MKPCKGLLYKHLHHWLINLVILLFKYLYGAVTAKLGGGAKRVNLVNFFWKVDSISIKGTYPGRKNKKLKKKKRVLTLHTWLKVKSSGKKKSPRHGGEMAWLQEIPRNFRAISPPCLGLCFLSRPLKMTSSLYTPSRHFSAPGFWKLI